jgi:hypothetical protein
MKYIKSSLAYSKWEFRKLQSALRRTDKATVSVNKCSYNLSETTERITKGPVYKRNCLNYVAFHLSI